MAANKARKNSAAARKRLLIVKSSCVQIISNPDAGSYSETRMRALQEAWDAAGYTVINSQCSPRAGFELAPAATIICIAGGDGTARHALAALQSVPALPPICVYPMGTVNLIALEQEASRDPRKFVAQTLRSPPARYKPVLLNDTLFSVCASIGPDALAVARVSERLKQFIGRAAYGVALLQIGLKWQRPKLRVIYDEGTFDCEAIYIANGRYFAGKFSFAPEARLESPLLHIVALKRAKRFDFLAFMIAVLRGRAQSLQNAISVTTTSLDIRADQDCPVQADGDIATHLPAKIVMRA